MRHDSELQVCQAELEIQNEERRRPRKEISQLEHEYENLYGFAPVSVGDDHVVSGRRILQSVNFADTRQVLPSLFR